MKVVLFFAISMSLAGISFAQPSSEVPAPVIAEIFLAKANVDGKAGDPAENFIVSDVPIFCVVRMVSPGVISVKMKLIAVNVRGADPGEEVVTASYTTKSNEDRVNFKGRPHGLWVAGKYRAEIFIGDKKVRNIEFEIKPSSTEAERPAVPKNVRKPSKRSTSTEGIAGRSNAHGFH
jgi:hypothetical protein